MSEHGRQACSGRRSRHSQIYRRGLLLPVMVPAAAGANLKSNCCRSIPTRFHPLLSFERHKSGMVALHERLPDITQTHSQTRKSSPRTYASQCSYTKKSHSCAVACQPVIEQAGCTPQMPSLGKPPQSCHDAHISSGHGVHTSAAPESLAPSYPITKARCSVDTALRSGSS